MKVYLRIKFRAFGITYKTMRWAWGISFDSTKREFSIGPLTTPKDSDIDFWKAVINRNGVTLSFGQQG